MTLRHPHRHVVVLVSEPWGVSNHVRPAPRAPRRDEEVFRVADGELFTIEFRVSRCRVGARASIAERTRGAPTEASATLNAHTPVPGGAE